MVSGVDDLRLDLDRRAADVSRHGQLVDVEAEVVEPADPLLHAPPVTGLEALLLGQLRPQALVAPEDAVGHLDRVGRLLEEPARGEVHELARDVDQGDLQVVLALTVGQAGMQLARLSVHEVGGERPGVPAEQGVRQGDVAPPEAAEMQPHEEDGEGVDEPLGRVGAQVLAVERTVGEGEPQVPGQQAGVERAPVSSDAAADDAERLDAGQVEPAEEAQHVVLAPGQLLLDLLDRQHPPGDPHEAHDVPRDAPGKGGQRLGRPLLQRERPGEVEQRRIGSCGGELEGHRVIVPRMPGGDTMRPRSARRRPRGGARPGRVS